MIKNRYRCRKPVFRSQIICGALIVVVCIAKACVTPDQKQLSADQRIIEIIGETASIVDNIIASQEPAESVTALQRQIKDILSSAEVIQAYGDANEKLNEVATIDTWVGPYGVPNFYRIEAGIYRSANPTLGQAKQLVTKGTVDQIIAVNIELADAIRYDPNPSVPLTGERVKAIQMGLRAKGKSDAQIRRKINFYKLHLEYAVAVEKKKFKWLQLIPIDGPQNSLHNYFRALEALLEFRKDGKKALFHCTVGKHRTGLLAMIVKVLESGGTLSEESKTDLYLEFVKRNWNRRPQSRVQHLVILPAITRSKPFVTLAKRWQSRTGFEGVPSGPPGGTL